ncbi:hypothetical protein [Candidatus Puniceispirillum sp.]|jgi:hypothetical protein|uniref:hypothetical protein n=1 Tax=Candidatus Puniceispirillum sp. TaxID=2026719 RepID=UPI001EBBBFFF|nr:hypothetical protein [Candidatus Puniceispirillum sp.]
MSSEYNAVQESIKIALDAADAATDVSSEFNKIKRENKKLEGSIKMIHRYTAIIFASSMVAAVAALIFASLIYFRTLSDLTTMTTTSREALVVFAENVDTMNSSLDKLKVSLEAQQELVSLNKTLIADLDTLRTTIIDSNREVIASMRDSNEKMSADNDKLAKAITNGIANEMGSQTSKITKQMAQLAKSNEGAMDSLARSMASNEVLSQVSANQAMLANHLEGLSGQNQQILAQFKAKDNKVSYP